MRTVSLRLLPPDENGVRRVRIHYFHRDDLGPVNTGRGGVETSHGLKFFDGARGLLACRPQEKDTATKLVNGVHLCEPHSDDVRAVTCPECRASEVFKQALAEVESQA